MSRPFTGRRWPDVVIAGAGPAGAALAARLARLGMRVLLIDPAAFPRGKACGESLNPGAVAALERLGAGAALTAASPLRGWRLFARIGAPDRGAARPRECRLPFPSPAAGVARVRLDAELLRFACAAGAEFAQGWRAEALIWDRGVPRGLVAVRPGRPRALVPARVVVGADGLHSRVRRLLGLQADAPAPDRHALSAHYTGIDGVAEWGELHFAPWGVCGLAPVGEGVANVVVVLHGAPELRFAGDKAGRMQEALAAVDSIAGRLAGAALLEGPRGAGAFRQPVRAAARPGALLVGDAAGYFDPLTGQGIYRALRSAELAAEVVATALDTGAAGDPWSSYDRKLRREFGASYLLQRLIDAAVRRPPLLDALVGWLSRHPRAAARLAAWIGDCRQAAHPLDWRWWLGVAAPARGGSPQLGDGQRD